MGEVVTVVFPDGHTVEAEAWEIGWLGPHLRALADALDAAIWGDAGDGAGGER